MKIEIHLYNCKGKREDLENKGSVLLPDAVLQRGRCTGLLYTYTLHWQVRLLEFI
jgi:hypothetical protein